MGRPLECVNKKILFFVLLVHVLVLVGETPGHNAPPLISHFGQESEVSIRFRSQTRQAQKVENTSLVQEKRVRDQNQSIEREQSQDRTKDFDFNAVMSDEREQGREARDLGVAHITDQYVSQLRAIVEKNKRYPSQAIRMRQEGKTEILLRLSQAGEVLDVKIIKGSGSVFLDRASLAVIEKVGRFPQVPEELAVDPFQVSFTLTYQL